MEPKQVDMMRKIPDVLKDVREIKALIDTENIEMNLLNAALALYLNNTFVETADSYGIGRWEAMLQIVPKLTDTLDERRFRVLSRINERLPFTIRSLEQQLATLCGPSGYTVELLHEQYLLKVRVELTAKSKLEDVRKDNVSIPGIFPFCTFLLCTALGIIGSIRRFLTSLCTVPSNHCTLRAG